MIRMWGFRLLIICDEEFINDYFSAHDTDAGTTLIGLGSESASNWISNECGISSLINSKAIYNFL